MIDMELVETLRLLAEERGSDFFGIADLSSAVDAITEQGGIIIAGFPKAVSIGITLPHAIVDRLPDHNERAVAASYRHIAYEVMNTRLDLIASEVTGILQKAGYRALPVPPRNGWTTG